MNCRFKSASIINSGYGEPDMRKLSLVGMWSVSLTIVAVASAQENVPKASPQTPAGFVLIDEDQWHLMSDEPDRHIGRAREAFLMADVKTAAAELRKAAVHLRIATGHAAERGKKSLVRAEHDMDQMAKRIEAGSVKSVEELDMTTSRALHALADYQYVKAAEAWRKREARASGRYLRAAVDNMERAAARTDARMRAATAEVAKESRLMSSKLIEGTGYVIDEIGAGFETVGHEIERVGARVAPSKVTN